jgi:L-malate glycosyltransferase
VKRAMLDILHLDTGTELRGGQWQLLALAEALRSRGHAQVIVARAGCPLAERARALGFDTVAGRRHPWRPGAIRRLLRSKPFHVIHAHDGRSQSLAWIASAGFPVCRIASRRVTFTPAWPALHRLKYNLTCHGIIAVSCFVRDLLVGMGIASEKIEVIPDGVALPEKLVSASERKSVRARWRLDDEDLAVGHVGAFTHEKGQDVAIESAHLVAATLPRVKLLLAGDGPLRKKLEQQDRNGNVRFLGRVDDLADFLNALDVFIMPSREEGLGSSALRAMAYGLPVIASRTGGLPEIVEDGRTGWLVDPGSPQALARAVSNAAAHPELLRRLGENARASAQGFTNDIMGARTETFYADRLERLRGAKGKM